MGLTVLLGIVFAVGDTMWRPYIYQTVYIVLALFGFLNGYVTTRTLKFFGTTDWNFSAAMSAIMLPLFLTGAVALEVIVAWLSRTSQRYSAAETIIRTLAWYSINAITCYIGAYRGYLQSAEPRAAAVGKVTRSIPPQPFFLSFWVIVPVFGFIQFAAIYAEFTYFFDSLFRSKMYAMFGFFTLNMILLLVIICLLSIISTYMQLCS